MDAAALQSSHHFGWQDYTIFGLMLFLSSMIGVYFGCFGKKQKTYNEFMLGGRKIGLLPICVSNIASHISSLTLMAVPTEIYLFGTLYWLLCPALIMSVYVSSKIFIPVFYRLNITNVQQYLELRFDKTVRMIGTLLYCLNTLLFLPIVIYSPSLALNQVSGINLHVIGGTVCVICIFYTMLGGLKAIVWTDGLQALIMLFSCILWVVMGTWMVGGVAKVWEISDKGGRIRLFDMDPSPLVQRSFWTMILGNFASWLFNFGINPVTIQRYLAVQNQKEAKIVMMSYYGGTVFMTSLSAFMGLILYATYGDCDLVLQKVISKHDQLLAYFVMDNVGHIAGLPGLFIAAIFSAALSSMSACINTLSGTIYEEFMASKVDNEYLQHGSTLYVKLIMIPIGIFCLLAMFVIDNLGEIIQLTVSINGISLGTLVGIYILGMTCPWANVKGIIVGVISSLVLVTWIAGGAQLAIWNGSMAKTTLPLSTDGCQSVFNSTISSLQTSTFGQEKTENESFLLFKVSFMYYSLLGCLMVIIIGGITSFFTRTHDLKTLQRDLIAPPFQFLLPSNIPAKAIELKLLENNNQ